jgi:hypothetical protein
MEVSVQLHSLGALSPGVRAPFKQTAISSFVMVELLTVFKWKADLQCTANNF